MTNSYQEYLDKLTPAELKALMRRVLGPRRRRLVGQEADNVMLMIQIAGVDPVSSSNNQRTCTDVYELAQKTYYVTYGSDWFEIDEMLEDD